MRQLYIDWHPNHATVALMENGRLTEVFYERDTSPKLVGSIFKGKVENTLKGMMAAFVNIGQKKNAYLNVGESLVDLSKLDGGKALRPSRLNVSPGDTIMCQVVKDCFGEKGARVSTDVSIPGRFVVLMPNSSFFGISRKIGNPEKRAYLEQLMKEHTCDEMGFIARTLADKATDQEIIQEMGELCEKWKAIKKAYDAAPVKTKIYSEADLIMRTVRDLLSPSLDEVIVNKAVIYERLLSELKAAKLSEIKLKLYEGKEFFLAHFGILEQIDRRMGRRVELENGAYLNFDRTEALTVVDVNTGKFVGETDLEDTVFQTNLVAAEEIAIQIRLRNLGGIIIVDFIDMKSDEHRKAVLEKLADCVKSDRIKTTVVGMTSLGLVEITRKKERVVFNDMFLTRCHHCNGAGYIYINEMTVVRIREALIKLFEKEDTHEAVVTVNSTIADEMFDLNIFERELMHAWSEKVIYVDVDEAYDGSMFKILDASKLTDSDKQNLRTL